MKNKHKKVNRMNVAELNEALTAAQSKMGSEGQARYIRDIQEEMGLRAFSVPIKQENSVAISIPVKVVSLAELLEEYKQVFGKSFKLSGTQNKKLKETPESERESLKVAFIGKALEKLVVA